ncbi:MAG: cell wall metabolism sensor histidine kinase WalK [Nitrospira sp.]|nr:cell wall metabolism sensor histidine kinase WalK [Nitrospira sp.]MDH4303251.1 cell wall metabolism sensor histidine kinase WalK [Nitrospira sp.]MDH5193515.1 cell wall metabolism sensor histidine kinase WalK [Nitrospira sp.]
MSWSIRWKVAIGTLVAVACGLLIAGWMMLRSLEQRSLTQFGEILEAKTKLVEYGFQGLFHSSTPLITPSGLQNIARDLGSRSSARITLIASDGTVLADSAVHDVDISTLDNHLARPEVTQAITTGQGQDVRPSHTTGERMMYHARLLKVPHDTAPWVVRVALPLAHVDRVSDEFKHQLFLAIGVASLLAVTLSIWLAHSITKPLSEIASAAQALSTGNSTKRIKTTTQDEVGLLASTLNQMADQLHTKIEELSEDRAQLLAVLTSMVEGVMVLDARGHVLQINPALERMFGISRVEARGRPCAELFRHQQLNNLVTTTLRARTPREDEIVLPLNGRHLHIEASPAGGERDNEACIVLVFHDVTDLRRLEKIRKDFVANVSHELRTPLTSIKGYVEALLDGGKDDPSVAGRFLEIILKQSDRLNLIIEDLLELSKIESGQISLREEPIDLRALVDRTLSTIKPIADRKGHRLVTALDPSLPLMAGDEDRLVQVLTNLLDNAIKYTPEGGTITVGGTAASSPDTADPSLNAIDLSVADTGIGIPERDRPRIFERFYRVDKARSRDMGGTGLGLAIVKHLVEGHGGQVWVEANHPQGSRFVVRLPIKGGKRLITQWNHDSTV